MDTECGSLIVEAEECTVVGKTNCNTESKIKLAKESTTENSRMSPNPTNATPVPSATPIGLPKNSMPSPAAPSNIVTGATQLTCLKKTADKSISSILKKVTVACDGVEAESDSDQTASDDTTCSGCGDQTLVDVAAALGEVSANESSSMGESDSTKKQFGLESTSGSPTDLGSSCVCATYAGVDNHAVKTNNEVKHAKKANLETTNVSNVTACPVSTTTTLSGPVPPVLSASESRDVVGILGDSVSLRRPLESPVGYAFLLVSSLMAGVPSGTTLQGSASSILLASVTVMACPVCCKASVQQSHRTEMSVCADASRSDKMGITMLGCTEAEGIHLSLAEGAVSGARENEVLAFVEIMASDPVSVNAVCVILVDVNEIRQVSSNHHVDCLAEALELSLATLPLLLKKRSGVLPVQGLHATGVVQPASLDCVPVQAENCAVESVDIRCASAAVCADGPMFDGDTAGEVEFAGPAITCDETCVLVVEITGHPNEQGAISNATSGDDLCMALLTVCAAGALGVDVHADVMMSDMLVKSDVVADCHYAPGCAILQQKCESAQVSKCCQYIAVTMGDGANDASVSKEVDRLAVTVVGLDVVCNAVETASADNDPVLTFVAAVEGCCLTNNSQCLVVSPSIKMSPLTGSVVPRTVSLLHFPQFTQTMSTNPPRTGVLGPAPGSEFNNVCARGLPPISASKCVSLVLTVATPVVVSDTPAVCAPGPNQSMSLMTRSSMLRVVSASSTRCTLQFSIFPCAASPAPAAVGTPAGATGPLESSLTVNSLTGQTATPVATAVPIRLAPPKSVMTTDLSKLCCCYVVIGPGCGACACSGCGGGKASLMGLMVECPVKCAVVDTVQCCELCIACEVEVCVSEGAVQVQLKKKKGSGVKCLCAIKLV